MAERAAPSPFFADHLGQLCAASGRAPVLDVACGRGRHALAAGERGLSVVGIDRDTASLAALYDAVTHRDMRVAVVRADLETGRGLPLAPARCGGVLVFRYLFRPLARALAETLKPGGLLLYETFTIHQRELGYGPKNPEFLLRAGELPGLFPGLQILEVWEGLSEGPHPEALARLVARRPA